MNESLSRPTSVTVVSWIVIVFCVFGLYGMVSSLRMMQSGEYERIMADPRLAAALKDLPKPSMANVVIGTAALVAELIAGILMLKGNGLGRTIYVTAIGLGMASSLVMGIPLRFLLPSLVVNGILVACMFLPSANAYYAARKSQSAY
jgi:hypothetical protein